MVTLLSVLTLTHFGIINSTILVLFWAVAVVPVGGLTLFVTTTLSPGENLKVFSALCSVYAAACIFHITAVCST